jgi:hypothetical protein
MHEVNCPAAAVVAASQWPRRAASSRRGLIIANHVTTGSLSSLDLALCDPSLYQDYNWSVCKDLCGSDHYPTILSEPVGMSVDDQKRWMLAEADWASYQDLCSSSLNPTALMGSTNKFKSLQILLFKLLINRYQKPVVNVARNRDPGSTETANQQ